MLRETNVVINISNGKCATLEDLDRLRKHLTKVYRNNGLDISGIQDNIFRLLKSVSGHLKNQNGFLLELDEGSILFNRFRAI